MTQLRGAFSAATAALVLLLVVACDAAPPEDKVKFRFRNHPGGARSFGMGKLQKILRNSGRQGGATVDDLIDALDTNDDMVSLPA
jgi:hypothetical protein